eukprot:138565-Pyramimonas_sp.AAC.1
MWVRHCTDPLWHTLSATSPGRSANTSGASSAPRTPGTFLLHIGRALPSPTANPRKHPRTSARRIRGTFASRGSPRNAAT